MRCGNRRVVLEHRVHVPLVGRQPGDVLALQLDAPGGRLLEAADHPQRGRLAAAGRAEQAEELAVHDLEVDVVDREDVAEGLRDLDQPNVDVLHGYAAAPGEGTVWTVGRAGRARPRATDPVAPRRCANDRSGAAGVSRYRLRTGRARPFANIARLSVADALNRTAGATGPRRPSRSRGWRPAGGDRAADAPAALADGRGYDIDAPRVAIRAGAAANRSETPPMSAISEAAVLDALRTVQEPELGGDLVTRNMVKDLAIDGLRRGLHDRADHARLPAQGRDRGRRAPGAVAGRRHRHRDHLGARPSAAPPRARPSSWSRASRT